LSASARDVELIRSFAGSRLLVIGDLILDRYVWGSTDRISPEAPVPVVRVDRESSMLGGAGNVARNLSSLGAQVELVSVTGRDDAGAEIRRLCDAWKIETRHVVADRARPTTEKTRIIARGQQVVRYDREVDDPVPEAVAQALIESLQEAAARADGAILEDYQKGLLGGALLAEMLGVLARAGVRVFVDPKGPPWSFQGVELVKPNLREAELVAQIRVRGDADLEHLGRRALELSGAGTVAITRGREGMTLFSRGEPTLHVPTAPRAVADVAGAGDTAIAVLALARLAGAGWRDAARIANAASGVVVSVPGTATVSPDELLAALGAVP
jgi:D-beta-D-heptose 7-phosphate kinase/D-beta-D-heptose 1-phosphate adenosyltransferase